MLQSGLRQDGRLGGTPNRRLGVLFASSKGLTDSAVKAAGCKTLAEAAAETADMADLIPGFLPARCCTVISGSMGCRKSWLMAEMAVKLVLVSERRKQAQNGRLFE